MSNNGSYANERPPSLGDPEVGSDPASGGFFVSDYKKHEDLKAMLDSNKDGLKLEAMKRTIGMVAKGKDASDLFPAVVKNVVSKNIEVKKLVYVYLVRYAEEQQDLALLSISTFQRGLKDPNQLIRASALRVLSSIRVPVIVPIMMLAIKESVNDMSPYVRRTAAHAIPKLYSLDPEQKEQLIEVIEKLLSDKTTLVVGSAVMAFEEVCPERIDLIHKNYRKLCNLLVDVEEWGQVVIINMLTRYARTQFLDPNKNEFIDENDVKSFYDSEASESEEPKKKLYVMDPDHRLLLRNCKPLLQSRNAAVVMAVAQLYHYLAPKSEVSIVSKALVRLLRSHREVQSVVLCNIATMSTKRRGMFEPFLKSFFVRSSDATHIKLLKLEILTNLVTETSSSTILREFQTYVSSSDKEFVAATIQAIGRCASNISEVTDTCLNGLVSLMSNRDESVVAESVVVIKKLLQMRPTEHKDIIIHMAKLVDSITVPMARASILWLLGEYSDRVPKIAPDVLRKMAKSFIQEEDIVKLQILNLATKLYLTNSKQTRLLCQYVFNLAKYDQNYDIRDRARFLKQMIFPSEKCGVLAKYAKKIFLATKPAPVLESKFKDRDQLQLGTLSHYINSRAYGYHDLPEFPEAMPDPSVRNVEVTLPWTDSRPLKKKLKKKSFCSESESSSAIEAESQNEESSSGLETESNSSSSSSEESGTSGSESEDEDHDDTDKKKKEKVNKSDESNSEEETSSSEESTDSGEDNTDDSEEDSKKKSSSFKETETSKQKTCADLLLDLDDLDVAPNTTPLLQGHILSMLTPALPNLTANTNTEKLSNMPILNPVYLPAFIPTKQHELLNRITGNGLSVNYRFTRNQHLFSAKMVSLEVTFTNNSDSTITDIKIGEMKLQSGMQIHSFAEIGVLEVNSSVQGTLGIDFCDSTQPANFEICVKDKKYNVSIVAAVGELLQGGTITETEFLNQQKKLGGMNENSTTIDLPNSNITPKVICSCVLEAANVAQITTNDESLYHFAAETLSTRTLVLVSIKILDNQKVNILVNCEKMVIILSTRNKI